MKTIDQLMVIPGDLHRVKIHELTDKRVQSFREAVVDFCSRSKSNVHPVSIWNYICDILSGKQPGEVWVQFNGDSIISYCITYFRQDFDGKWTLTIAHAWADPSQKIEEHVKQIRIVMDDAFKKGFDRVSFTTRRNSKAWKRLFKDLFVDEGTIFEAKKETYYYVQ